MLPLSVSFFYTLKDLFMENSNFYISNIIKNMKDIIDNQKYIIDNEIEQNVSYSFTINCNSLSTDDECIDDEFTEDFKALEKMNNNPIVYWFEITSEQQPQEIIDKIEEYSEREDVYKTPASNNKDKSQSRCLYVGKVRNNIHNRMKQHLGFSKTKKTQGLQLGHWAKDIDLELKVHVHGFNEEMKYLVSVIEIELANELNPILGQHK